MTAGGDPSIQPQGGRVVDVPSLPLNPALTRQEGEGTIPPTLAVPSEGGDRGLDRGQPRAALPPSHYRRFRDVVDRVVALGATVAVFPLLAAIAVAIRLDSPGPVLFRQLRCGHMGRQFIIFKFRTMATSAPAYSLKVSDVDPRITRVGRMLRRTGLDELPQLCNVIRGEMNLIGPRPEQLLLLGLYEPWMEERHLIRPGLTGWWQIHHRDTRPMHLGIDKDIFYVRNQSPRLDAIILWRTLGIVVRGLVHRRGGVHTPCGGPETGPHVHPESDSA